MINVLTVFWGDKHFDYFCKGLVPSLKCKKNWSVIQNCQWYVYTEEKYFKRISTLIEDNPYEFFKGNLCLMDIRGLRDRTDSHHSALIKTIRKCLDQNRKLLLAPPDTIFGDGSIPNMLKIGFEKNTVVASPHPRVHDTILNDKSWISNRLLVKSAWKNLHKSWVDAETNHPAQNSFIGGVSWVKLDENIYSVKHLLPTPYLMDFTEEDYIYFYSCPGFGHIDHDWSTRLVQEERLIVIGSSEACFIVEMTDRYSNIPPASPGQNPEKFWKPQPKDVFTHNKLNAQFRTIFSGL